MHHNFLYKSMRARQEMRKLKTYLAGAFCPLAKGSREYKDWRDYVIKNTGNPKIDFFDPRRDSRQLCPATFTLDDASGVLNSDILFHYRTRGYEDDGASWEHGIAFAYNLLVEKWKLKKKQKFIILADETSVPFPLNSASADVTFNSLEVAVEFLNSINSAEKFEFMHVWMKLLDRERAGRK